MNVYKVKMQKHFFWLCYLCLMNLLTIAQNKTLQEGYNVFYYPSGKISAEGFVKNGKPDGYWKTYYENGKIKSEGKRTNGKLDSIWTFYDENGFLIKKISYHNDLKEGFTINYADSNKLFSKEFYRNNKRDSILIYLYPDGKIKQTIPLENGIENGYSYEYDTSGNVITIIYYVKGTVAGIEQINRYNKKGQKDGVWKEFYDDMRVKKEYRYVNGVLNGYYKEYNRNGQLEKAILYVNGEPVDNNPFQTLEIKKKYDEKGRLLSEGTYDSKGRKMGSFKMYNPETGKIFEEYVYFYDTLIAKGPVDENFQRQGQWEEYYTNGNIKARGQYQDGKKTGEWIYFYPNGKIEQRGKYVNGLPHGKWLWFYDNGQLLREENYVKGKRDGEFYEFTPQGDTMVKAYYIEDKLDGEWMYFLNDYKEVGQYQDGKKTGVWKAYDTKTGNLIFTGEFVDGLENGLHKYFYPSGKIMEERYYSLGIKQGTWKKYDELGQVYLIIDYEAGMPIKIGNVRVDNLMP